MERARPALPHEYLPLPFPLTASFPDTQPKSPHSQNPQPVDETTGIIYDAREAERAIHGEELLERLKTP